MPVNNDMSVELKQQLLWYIFDCAIWKPDTSKIHDYSTNKPKINNRLPIFISDEKTRPKLLRISRRGNSGLEMTREK